MPPLTVHDYLRALTDPSPHDLRRFLLVGRQETWRKSGMLATRLRLAHALQKLEDALDGKALPADVAHHSALRPDGSARAAPWPRCALGAGAAAERLRAVAGASGSSFL